MSDKPMVARCPECGEKFKDPLLFVARVSMQEHRAEAHPEPAGRGSDDA